MSVILAPYSWREVAEALKTQALGTKFQVKPSLVRHPLDDGMRHGMGFPTGQRADYKMEIDDNHRLVVLDFGTHYLVHLEQVVTRPMFESALQETPGTTVAGMVAVGALIGLALGRSKEGAIAGAAIGGLAALAGVAVANAESSPETAKMAASLTNAFSHKALPTPSVSRSASRLSESAASRAGRKALPAFQQRTPRRRNKDQ